MITIWRCKRKTTKKLKWDFPGGLGNPPRGGKSHWGPLIGLGQQVSRYCLFLLVFVEYINLYPCFPCLFFSVCFYPVQSISVSCWKWLEMAGMAGNKWIRMTISSKLVWHNQVSWSRLTSCHFPFSPGKQG